MDVFQSARPKPRLVLLAPLGALVLAIVAPGGSAAGTSLRVCPSGCPFVSIAAALAAANDGDTISVAAGTYPGGFAITNDVSLVGAGVDATTITGGGPVVFIPSGVDATIARVTISGGNFVAGGGIRNEGTLMLKQSAVSNNFSSCCGAGIENVGTLTVRQRLDHRQHRA